MWKGARKWGVYLCKILIKVTWVFWKMCIWILNLVSFTMFQFNQCASIFVYSMYILNKYYVLIKLTKNGLFNPISILSKYLTNKKLQKYLPKTWNSNDVNASHFKFFNSIQRECSTYKNEAWKYKHEFIFKKLLHLLV